MRTLMDTRDTDRPERRTALVSRELARFNIDVAALSETRLPGEGQIAEMGSGYTFFWKGKPPEEHRSQGVGFAVKTQLVKAHNMTPNAINERIITLRLPLPKNQFITLISVYAPTLDAEDHIKGAFYQQLDTTITQIPAGDRLLLLGDFNARVGRDHELWQNIIGRQGVGNCNDNGLLLLGLCAEQELFITNTQFRLPTRMKTTWKHPRSKHWHILDYAIVKQQHKNEVLITRSMPGADDCWTDHRLLITKLKLTIKKRPRNIQHNSTRRKYDTGKLNDPETSRAFRTAVQQNMPDSDPSLDLEWTNIRNAINEAARTVIGHLSKRHQDWFDDNDELIKSLIDDKRKARIACEQDPNSIPNKTRYVQAKAQCQSRLREIQNEWWQQLARDLQNYADSRDLRNFFAGTKKIFGPKHTAAGTLMSVNNTILTEDTDIQNRWVEYFNTLLNRNSAAHQNFIQNVPQYPPQPRMSLPPTVEEFNVALKQMSQGKAAGPDNIPTELLTHGGVVLKTRLYSLILKAWEQKQVPSDWKDALLVTIFKKGDRRECGNYRGISLLSVAGKILARILLNRLQDLAERILPESQCGFRPSRGTIDMIFCARQLQEKAKEQQKPIFLIFYDLEKAYDSVPRTAMWSVLSRFGVPEPFVDMIKALHDGMSAKVIHQSNLSAPFPITCGLKQGCVLAPTLFSLYLAAMIHEIPHNNPGVEIKYRFDGGIFKLARLKSRRLTNTIKVTELQYADDNAAAAHSPAELQESVDNFHSAYSCFGLTVNKAKTKILAQPRPGENPPNVNITMDGTTIECVEHFPYLGSILSTQSNCSKEIENRLQASHTAFGRLSTRVFKNKDLTIQTKVMVYKAVVVSTLLYACETWTIYSKDLKKLEQFHQKKLRTIMQIKWDDYVSNINVLKRANVTSIEAMIMKHRLRWSGHVVRMENTRLPKEIFFSELNTGDRPRGRPLLRYKDQLKKSLNEANIDPNTFEISASNRDGWRNQIQVGANLFEDNRRAKLVAKQQQRALRASQPQPPPTIQCDQCPRLFRARIGLYSHKRTHHPDND